MQRVNRKLFSYNLRAKIGAKQLLRKKPATVSGIRKYPQVFLMKAKKRDKRAKHLIGKKKNRCFARQKKSRNGEKV